MRESNPVYPEAVSSPDPVRYQFPDGVVDPARNLVILSGRHVTIEPRAMEVLEYLVAQGGRVVAKEELLEAVWQGRWVTGESLTVYIYELRKALGDDAKDPRFVETVRKRGYRWIPPVTVETAAVDTEAHGTETVQEQISDGAFSGQGNTRGEPERSADTEVGSGQPTGAVDWGPKDIRTAERATRKSPRYSSLGLCALMVMALTLSAHDAETKGASPSSSALAAAEAARGEEHLRNREPQDLLRAETSYRRAAELDPKSAEAWGGLSLTLAMMAEFPMRDRFKLYHGSRSAAELAHEIDPEQSFAHVALALVELTLHWNRDAAYQHIERALANDPGDPQVWEVRAWLDVASGRRQEALYAIEQAMRLDPLASRLFSLLAYAQGLFGDQDAMIDALNRSLDLEPNSLMVHSFGWSLLWTHGRHEEALTWLVQGLSRNGQRERSERLQAAYDEGGFEGMLKLYVSMLPAESGLVEQARVALFFADPERALELLERAMSQRDSELTWINQYPEFQPLHDHPRFQAIVKRVHGLT